MLLNLNESLSEILNKIIHRFLGIIRINFDVNKYLIHAPEKCLIWIYSWIICMHLGRQFKAYATGLVDV